MKMTYIIKYEDYVLDTKGGWTKDTKKYWYFKTHKEALWVLRLFNDEGYAIGAIILRYDKS